MQARAKRERDSARHQATGRSHKVMDKPFAILEQWVREGRIHLSDEMPGETNVENEPRDFPFEVMPQNLSDAELFDFAMKDVKSLGWSSVPLHNRPPVEIQGQDEEQDALRVLEEFLRRGRVDIEDTPEYIEGSVHPHGRLYLKDLRSGRFSVRAHLDLHGLTLQDARFVLEAAFAADARASIEPASPAVASPRPAVESSVESSVGG